MSVNRVAALVRAAGMALAVAGALWGSALRPATALAATDCAFVLGFAALKAQLPDVVGQCLAPEQHDPATGETVQPTTKGLLVWRKGDNVMAFTDGHHTWIDGPNGLVYRLNTERFAWEPDAQRYQVVPERPPPLDLPGALLPARRLVTYYGNPRSAAMGILGRLPPNAMLDALAQEAARYQQIDPSTPVQPALELVAVVAQAAPGLDGLYRGRISAQEIEQVLGWARSRGYPLILDVQPGRSSFSAEVAAMLPFLEQPDVHLALDPEWAMRGSQVPGDTFGSVDASTVNEIVDTVATLVSGRGLPPKILVIHRFTPSMVTNSHLIKRDSRVQVVMAMDGVGGQAAKLSRYQQVITNQPVQFAGIKVFYTEDVNPLAPQQVLGLVPVPNVVIYQ